MLALLHLERRGKMAEGGVIRVIDLPIVDVHSRDQAREGRLVADQPTQLVELPRLRGPNQF